jgi:hypothetical protein
MGAGRGKQRQSQAAGDKVQGAAKDTIEDGSGEREAGRGASCRLKQEREEGRWKTEDGKKVP